MTSLLPFDNIPLQHVKPIEITRILPKNVKREYFRKDKSAEVSDI